MENEKRLARWRLILGAESEECFQRMGAGSLSEEEALMDQALAAIYNEGGSLGFRNGPNVGNTASGSGRGPSNPVISRWLGDIRTLFDPELVKIIQSDAVERCGLTQLLFEPELLADVEPDIGLVSKMLLLKDQVPQRSRDGVREYIRKVVEEINKRWESGVRRAVTAGVNRRKHSVLPSAAAIDFPTTIRRGLKNYDPERQKIVPEKFYFFERAARTAANKHTIILDIDQSGSMAESVLYASVLSCILASLSAVKTRVVAFDTKVTDLTERCEDPVDLLYGFQLGGGTDIRQSVVYCEQWIENPKKTIFFLISDLAEGGNRAGLLRSLAEMKSAGVTVISLLAIADGGKPYYDAQMAEKVAALGIPCFACSPERLPELLETAIKGQALPKRQ
ncbi:MAG: VWA domain-containing protein [Lachnospiraceae bacterium]|nr:VWA domain-containing protein [Lachnospiraceae bacterium]